MRSSWSECNICILLIIAWVHAKHANIHLDIAGNLRVLNDFTYPNILFLGAKCKAAFIQVYRDVNQTTVLYAHASASVENHYTDK